MRDAPVILLIIALAAVSLGYLWHAFSDCDKRGGVLVKDAVGRLKCFPQQ